MSASTDNLTRKSELKGTRWISTKRATLNFLRRNVLTLLTLSGVLAGVILGIILRTTKDSWTQREVLYVRFLGDLFLNMLKVLILPLIVASLVSCIGTLDLRLSGHIGARAIVYYLLTTVIAVVLGIILVTIIQPGRGGTVRTDLDTELTGNVTTTDTMLDLVRNMFPPNIIQACIEQYRTALVYPGNDSIPIDDWRITGNFYSGSNIIGLVVFATVLGICLSKMHDKGLPLLAFFSSLSAAMMVLTNWVIWLSPVGVCFLIAGQIVEQEDFARMFRSLGYYFVTVLLGLFIHGFIFLPLIFTLVTRTLPFRFVMNMMQAIATAFGTSSSSATLPVTIYCAEEKNHVDPRIARFVLTVGASINMDGTALYEAVAAIFIAQLVGAPLGFGRIVAISITSTAASVGAAGIPQAGLVTMVLVLNTISLPAEYIAYIIPVDWLLDRFRTAVNVIGDSFGAGIVEKLSRKDLDAANAIEAQNTADLAELNEIRSDPHSAMGLEPRTPSEAAELNEPDNVNTIL